MPDDRVSQEQMIALLEAARVAAHSTPDFAYPSVLRAAPSHTGAALLAALRAAGWALVRS